MPVNRAARFILAALLIAGLTLPVHAAEDRCRLSLVGKQVFVPTPRTGVYVKA
jgi:hypothetical protein